MIVQEQKEAAEIIGVTPRTLRDWKRDYPEEFPDCSEGYNIEALEAFRDEFAKKGSEGGSTLHKLKVGRQAEALKRDRIRTQREEYSLRLQEEELLPRQVWNIFASNLLAGLSDAAEQLPDLISGDCCKKCQKTVADRIKAELNRWREQLADDLKRSPQEQS